MRLDLYLKKTYLARQRAVAKQLCDQGAVLCNGLPAKPSQNVVPGDQLEIHSLCRRLVVRVVELPRGNVSKSQLARYFEVLEEEKWPLRDRILDIENPP